MLIVSHSQVYTETGATTGNGTPAPAPAPAPTRETEAAAQREVCSVASDWRMRPKWGQVRKLLMRVEHLHNMWRVPSSNRMREVA